MNFLSSRLTCRTLIVVVVVGIVAVSGIAFALSYSSTVTFDNRSGEPAVVKLVGPTPYIVDVPDEQNRTAMKVAPGEYLILVRYGNHPNEYTYSKGDPFHVEETAMSYSMLTITLHKVINGNYRTHRSSALEFAQALL